MTSKVRQSSSSAPGTAQQPLYRKLLMRLLAASFGLALLVCLELLLRLVGYGHSTAFFLSSEVAGRKVWIENQDFPKSYFPPGLARTPRPLQFEAVKRPEACRIFVFGESAAMGDPEPAYGFSRILEVLLRERYPERKFEVVNVAFTAINSHVIRRIGRECASREGDIWLIYMGNNEVVGPFGAGTVFGTQTPSQWFIRANLAVKATRLGQLLEDLRYRIRRPPQTPATWEGMEMFLNQQVRENDPRMQKVYQHFKDNLEDLVQTGLRSGVRLAVSTVAVNLKDCPPFASQPAPGLTPAAHAESKRLGQAGLAFAKAAHWPEALPQFEQAMQAEPGCAEWVFHLGRCYLALGQAELARECFARARDMDTLRFRADRQINVLISKVVDTYHSSRLGLLDAAELFDKQGTNGIAGSEFFLEHVHLNFDGNYLLARSMLGQIDGWVADKFRLSISSNRPPLSAAECAQRLALTDYDRYDIAEQMRKRLQLPPFTWQFEHEVVAQRWQQTCTELHPGSHPEIVPRALEQYRKALALAPEDSVLHERYAKLLQDAGDPAEAEKQWRTVMKMLPHYDESYYALANVLDSQGRSGEALSLLQKLERGRPEAVEVRNSLGLALANQGKTEAAIAQYKKALQQQPDFAQARINLGYLLAQQGQVEQALAEYATVLRQDSNNMAAHLNMGKLLAAQGQTAEALGHYREAVRLKPDNAVAQFNLGNASLTQGQPEPALACFAEAVRLDPKFAAARYSYGLELARQGKAVEALEQFAEVVRLKPEFAEAHLNLGVALAKLKRFQEATLQFRETLRLDPGNTQARKFLEQAEARQ